jgi:fructose-bisphosphate aldolase class II
VARTGVDCLAVSIGTLNGRLRGKPKLDCERLKRINDALKIPLVIHAGTGLADEQYRRLISHGVAKINCSSVLAEAAGNRIRANARADARGGYTGLVKDVREGIREEVERCMRLWGSAGRAAEVLVQCQAWQPVEHVILYNVEHAPDAQVEAMMARGREMLSMIPGVRRVVTGWAVADKPRYRFCWLIEFTHRAVIDSYREHPLHRQFADNLFRPLAVDRVSVDFEHVDAAPSMPVGRARESASG